MVQSRKQMFVCSQSNENTCGSRVATIIIFKRRVVTVVLYITVVQ